MNKKTQIDRIISRNHFTEKEAKELIGSQLPTDSKLKKADFQINSEKSLAYLKNQIVERVSFLEKNGTGFFFIYYSFAVHSALQALMPQSQCYF